jgi:hypothetical protein
MARDDPHPPTLPYAPPLPFGIGHNGGPPLYGTSWQRWCWNKAHKAAWKSPPREVVLRRMRRAKALGMTYEEYTLEILERGRYL